MGVEHASSACEEDEGNRRSQALRRRGGRGELLIAAIKGGGGGRSGGSLKFQDTILRQGWVEICSQEVGKPLDVVEKAWKRQYCVCQAGSVFIYDSIKSTRPDVIVSAIEATVEDCCETALSSPLILRLSGDGAEGKASYAFKLPSIEQKHAWVAGLRAASGGCMARRQGSGEAKKETSWDFDSPTASVSSSANTASLSAPLEQMVGCEGEISLLDLSLLLEN